MSNAPCPACGRPSASPRSAFYRALSAPQRTEFCASRGNTRCRALTVLRMRDALPELRRWLRSEGGLSSYTIAWVLCPELRDFCDGLCGSFGIGSPPADPSDFWRCREVLKRIPGGSERLGEVASAYPRTEWPALVEQWAELDALWEVESKRPDGMAPKLYQRMQTLRLGRRARKVDAR